jgi:DMSO/TMAO reductase YedYZ molybdopterin-dependent catalytic subunit
VGAPGHYGVAWVKWLQRIEVIDQRYAGRFMARDYVTIRGERQGDQTIWREKTVSRMNLKSIVARVVRRPNGDLRVTGAAWNDGVTPLEEVQLRIDDGPWQSAVMGEGIGVRYAWTFWSYDWKDASHGEHTLVSRVKDLTGKIQPAAEDDEIKLKRTYWEANQQVVRRIKI